MRKFVISAQLRSYFVIIFVIYGGKPNNLNLHETKKIVHWVSRAFDNLEIGKNNI